MLSRIKEYFEDRGVTAADLPKAFVVHEFMSVAFLALTWAACYQIQPSQSPLFAPINKTVQRSNNAFIVKGRESFATLVSKSEKKVSQEWLSKRGIDSGRVVLSLAESTLFRKLAKPVTIPAKLWLTLNFVQRIGGQRISDGTNNNDDDRHSSKGSTRNGKTHGGRAQEAAAAGKSSKGASGADTIVVEREGAGAKRSSSKAGVGLGWGGGGRSKRRRKKAICPPGTRGGTPGCFVAAFPVGAAVATASPLRAS